MTERELLDHFLSICSFTYVCVGRQFVLDQWYNNILKHSQHFSHQLPSTAENAPKVKQGKMEKWAQLFFWRYVYRYP